MRLLLYLIIGGLLLITSLGELFAKSDQTVVCNKNKHIFEQDTVIISSSTRGLLVLDNDGWNERTAPEEGEIRSAPGHSLYVHNNSSNNIYRSGDQGKTWILTGVFSPTHQVGVSLFPSPVEATLFSAVSDNNQYHGIHKSVDDGKTWKQTLRYIGNALSISFSANFASDGTVFAVLDAGRVTAGVWKSTDFGESWVAVNNGLFGSQSEFRSFWVLVSPFYAEKQIAYTGDNTGLYQTQNGGELWERVGEIAGFYMPPVFSDSFNQDQTLLIGKENYGLFLSTDGGRTTNQLWNGRVVTWGMRRAMPSASISTPSPTAPSTAVPTLTDQIFLPIIARDRGARELWLVVNSSPPDQPGECYLYRSRDTGKTWELITNFS